jgi:hypothetical protein
VSRGIIQSATRNRDLLELEIRELPESRAHSSEQPTLADLILPGSNQPVSYEFVCLLNVLCSDGEPA